MLFLSSSISRDHSIKKPGMFPVLLLISRVSCRFLFPFTYALALSLAAIVKKKKKASCTEEEGPAPAIFCSPISPTLCYKSTLCIPYTCASN